MASRAVEILDRLMNERPKFHQNIEDENVNWAINDRVLVWIAHNVQPGERTLETGCGYSTALFAAAGADHTAIAPAKLEFDRILAWCRQNSLPEVKAIVDYSQKVLPNLDMADLDVVLVDGDHSFPFPILDWYYTVYRLKVGGRLVLDDIHMRAVRVLHEFLQQEHGRWKLHEVVAQTSIFVKLVADPFESIFWDKQPWGAQTAMTPQRLFRRLVVTPGVRLIKKSDRLTNLLRPIYREYVVKRRK